MNEWAVGLTGENVHYGNIPNPYLAGCLSGGSSSGSARAVAMGIVPMALGSDTGGSIRMPAAWCGIVGLRPSSESFSLDGVVPRSRSLDVVGPLVKSLEDCDYFLGNAFTPKSSLITPENIPKSIQIGWDPSVLDGIEGSVRKAFIQFMENAQDNPSVSFVEQTWPSFIGASDCAMTILQMEFLNDFKLMCGEVELFTENLGKPVMNELRHSATLQPEVLIKAHEQLLQFRQGMAKMLSTVDMLALPLTPCGPVEAAKLPGAAKPLRELSLAMGASGLPIIGMPIISAKHGLDFTAPCLAGIQFVGQQFQEHKLIYIVKNYLDETVINDSISIVRPYCNLSDVADRLDITLNQAIDLERKARIIIDSETHGFKFVRKEKEYQGNNSDHLVVDERIYKLYKLYENKELIYDVDSNTNDSEYEISKDGSSVILDVTPTNRVDYSKVWRDRYLDADFADGYDYLVDADFGWKTIPEDVKYATEVLMQDIKTDSFRYINKYITAFDNEDFKVKFADTFTKGTGNLVVDKILSKYKNYIRAGVL
jgi:hypothetical protein